MDIRQREEIAAARKDMVLMLILTAIAIVHNMSFNDCMNLGVC